MKKPKTIFICQECGSVQGKWGGRCPDCGKWNSLVEEVSRPEPKRRSLSPVSAESAPMPLSGLTEETAVCVPSGIGELDRVLGGGVVAGSLVLIGGDPGIGKSTLLLQLCGKMADGAPVLYVTGEESARQLKMRAERLGVKADSILVYPETCVESIINVIAEIKPRMAVIDSIQTVFTETITSAPGSVGQLRESTALLMQTCKSLNIPIFLIGHVTKEGAIAGPRLLEHIVDTVLYFEGDRDHLFRILRPVKNRFGSTHEIGVFEMLESGLREVSNPSEIFVSGGAEAASGSVITCTLSGTRPILAELQALVTPTTFGNPRRTAVGFDYNRLVLLSAILRKRAGLPLDSEDIYVSAAGGMRVDDPGSDLALAAAIAGSFRDIKIERRTVFMGEVGLGGEVRPVTSLETRLKESARMGMKRAFIPTGGDLRASGLEKLEITRIPDIESLMDNLG